MINNPLVSIIVLFYNHENFVKEALDGIFSQTYTNFEVIIRDDGSTDNTKQVIKEYLLKHPQVVKTKLLLDDTNKGLIKGLNECLKVSEGEIITHCGGDDISYPDRVSITVELFLKYEVDLVASNALIVDKNNIPIKDQKFNIKSISKYGYTANNCVIIKNLKSNLTLIVGFGGYSLSYRRKLLEKFGGFFPEILTFEDNFLNFLANLNNGTAFCINNLLSYRRHENNWYMSPKLDYVKDKVKYKKDNAFDMISALNGRLEILKSEAYLSRYSKDINSLTRRIEKKIHCKTFEIAILLNEYGVLKRIKLLAKIIFNPYYPKDTIRSITYFLNPNQLKNN